MMMMIRPLVLLLSMGLLVAGVAVGVWAMMRRGGSSRPTQILKERFAGGELSPEEYTERLELLGDRQSLVLPLIVAAALVLAGLAGITLLGPRRGWMGGHMDSMMGRGGMMETMRGESGRRGSADAEEARDIRVSASEFWFRPASLKAKTGETVNLVLDNRGGMFHTLTIESLDFELRANAGERIGGSLSVEEGGKYEIVCTVPGHAEAGMRATLVVDG